MADTKIGDATLIGALALSDEIPVADASAATDVVAATLEQLWDLLTPKGYLWGLELANAADTAHDITVSEGEAKDEGHAKVMVLAAAITKQFDATWAVGNNAGGLNTGALAPNTNYEVCLIRRPDTGVVDVMGTTEANRGTLPTNYTQLRHLGWFRTDGSSNIRPGTYADNRFIYATPINDVSATVTTTATAVALSVPSRTIARFRATSTGNTSSAAIVVVFKEIDAEDATAPDDTTGVGSLGIMDVVGSGAGHYEIRVNASSQIEHDADATTGSPTFDISTFGWIDTRRYVF